MITSSINQRFENWTRFDYVSSYSSPPSPQVEVLAYLGYAKQRSRIAIQPMANAAAEGLDGGAQAEEVAL